jgi:transmembrane 9 superfamily protein 2/4
MTKKILVGLLALCGLSQAMYLPGVAPNDYEQGSDVPLFVNTLHPMSNLQKSVISYDYYDSRFHFCPPEGGAKKQAESLGSVLFGDRIFTSPFKVKRAHLSPTKFVLTFCE